MEYSIDQNQDYSSKELYNYLSGVDLPEYVKEAELDSTRVNTLEKTAFADQMGRLFPINSKANVYISNAFLTNKKAALNKLKGSLYVERVEKEINKAAEVLGIKEELNQYVKQANDKLNIDLADKTIKVKLAEDEVDLFNIKTAAHVMDGVDNFVKDMDRFPYAWRRSISEQFVKAAEDFGLTELPDIVVKYAGQYFPDIVHIKGELLRRSTKLAGEDKHNYIKLSEDIENIDDREDIFKLAEFCYLTEKRAGLYDNKYTRKVIKDPVDAFFTLHVDKVASLMDTVTMGGQKYAMEDLEKVSPDVYHQAFGFDVDVKSAEAKDILPTMPMSDVNLFKQLSGVKPI